jgi:hypothetical protein
MAMDPPVSVPIVSGSSRAATAAADPEDDPAAVRSKSHGLQVVEFAPPANSNVFIFAKRTAPAPTSRSATVASMLGTQSL